jgi:hypothetical protein
MALCIKFIQNKKYLTIACSCIIIIFLIILHVVDLDIYVLQFYQNGLLPEFIYGIGLYHLYKQYQKTNI